MAETAKQLTELALRRNLRAVQSGRRSRAPGIKKCPDCDQAWIADDSGLSHCPDCRVEHDRRCQYCRTAFRNTREGDRLCLACRHQPSLFDPEPAT